MVTIEHGDMVEQRRGGVDVLRVLVRNLAVHEQSGAVSIRSASHEHSREGWLLFRLGQPVMAFHRGELEQQGLEALLCIEEDALDVNNELRLYELTMNALRATMASQPDSVLHLEHQENNDSASSWWSSVRLPSASWRRAARLEEIETLALETEHRRRRPNETNAPHLEPGGVYLLDAPDPHPMISLGVELAERGMPLLGLFGLPHAETEATQRLPGPQSYALLSPHGGYDVLSDKAAVEAVVNAFQWGNERSVILIDGLDRLANAFGEAGMVDVFRSICDGVRFNDHIALVTTDLELFDTTVQHALLSESTSLRGTIIDRWVEDPDVLWDHPALLAPDEEEEQWLEAQIHHQGAQVGGPALHGDVFEGGAFAPDDEDRIEATQALSEVVEAWPEQSSPDHPGETSSSQTTVSIGSTPWRPEVDAEVVYGRYVSESPKAVQAVLEDEPTPRRSLLPKSKKTVEPAPPKLRTAQRLPARKQPPRMPEIDRGLFTDRSSAVVKSASPLPDWPVKPRAKEAFRRENMEGFARKQEAAVERHQKIAYPVQAKALKDSVAGSPDLSEATLPFPRVNKTVKLPSRGDSAPLTSSIRPVEMDEKPSREVASKSQAEVDVEKAYLEWSTFDEPDGADATALYNERGEALKRYGGEEP